MHELKKNEHKNIFVAAVNFSNCVFKLSVFDMYM